MVLASDGLVIPQIVNLEVTKERNNCVLWMVLILNVVDFSRMETGVHNNVGARLHDLGYAKCLIRQVWFSPA